jgi:hypothetical protein
MSSVTKHFTRRLAAGVAVAGLALTGGAPTS